MSAARAFRHAPAVLILEDEAFVRAIARMEFEDAGWRVFEAGDGAEALKALARNRDIELLFTDIRLPGDLDGWAVAEQARRTRPDLAVIYATGFTSEPPRLASGSLFFKKPYRLQEILDAAAGLALGRRGPG